MHDLAIDAAHWRRLIGHWPTGVSVITSVGPRGCTANALTSLSLDPLLVLVCLDLGSNTLAAVRESHRFCINVLASDQDEVARRFATKAPAEEKFAEVGHTDQDGLPVLDGCLAWIACDARDELPGGDHVIVTGAPVRAGLREDAVPLMSFRSEYRGLS